MTRRIACVVIQSALLTVLVMAETALGVETTRKFEEVAGQAVQHVVRPNGELKLPADGKIVVPEAITASARVQESVATESIIEFSPQVPTLEIFAYPGTTPPLVVPRKDSLTFYPCSRCHQHLPTNLTPRVLMPAHEVGLKHGDGRLWCLSCHDPQNRDQLHTLRDTKVDFDESWKICGQCHQARQKDWYFGAHGKRFYSWKGEPVRYNCTQCHNPHRPPFMHRKAQPPPPVRAGLEPMPRHAEVIEPVWNRHVERVTEETGHD